MTNRKNTKRALFSSVISLILCLSMLIGTTFAWFTDSVSSGVNQIVAGNLDVDVYYGDPAQKQSIAGVNTLFNDVKLWEPGVVAYENLTVANLGTLALKYELSVNFQNATATPAGKTLADVLQVAVVDKAIAENTTREAILADTTLQWTKLASFVEEGMLLPVDNTHITNKPEGAVVGSETYGIIICWIPGANDNDYNMNNENQGKVLSIDLGVKLEATQLTAEDDSFDNQYDANAPKLFSVNGTLYDTAAEALAAAKEGDQVYLSGATDPITVDYAMTLTIENTNIAAADGENAITVNANATIVANGANILVGGKNADGIHVAEGAKLTLSGEGALETKGNAGFEYFTKRVNGTEYGNKLSNTADASYAGKGGSGIDAVGELVIDGLANLVAEGYGIHGFGIGGSSKSITIQNTTVNYARGGFVCAEMYIPENWGDYYYGKSEPEGGAAIGSSTDGAVITIADSTVIKAEGGSKGAGIGALFHTGVTVNITNSNVTAFGGNASAGIGGSRVESGATAVDAINVNIKNSTVYAVGGDYAAGIGSGYNTYAQNIAKTPTTTVTIDAASQITAQGGKLGAGIGTGHNVINFKGDIACDVSNVKAGDNRDECCMGNLCSNVEDIGNGAYRIDQLYTKVSDGFYSDAAGNFYVYNAAGLENLHAWYTDTTNASYNMRKGFWGKTYNIMSDIDATDVTWTTVRTNMDSATSNGVIFNGNGHTISGMTIEGNGLFSGATHGTVAANKVTLIQNLTLDDVTVTGNSHHNGAVWGEVIGSITLDNVHVINSKVSGGCNVGGLIGRNSESHATITFKDCSVENTTVAATKQADNAGASAFLGMALRIGDSCSANVVFDGTNVAEGNTLTTADGMQGGGIYTCATWDTATWDTPTVVDSFTNYSSK